MVADHLWATSYAITAYLLFTRFNFSSRMKIKVQDLPYKYQSKPTWLCAVVFKYFFYLLVVDIIENKTTFRFPRSSRAFLEMIPTSGDDFIRARLNGAFLDVDFLTSNYTGYRINLRFNTRYGKWTKALHITEKYKDRITELTNKGHGW